MSKQIVAIGAVPNDDSGDPLRDAYDKINDNFNEVYASIGNGSTLAPFTAASIDTLAKVNAIVADATLIDTADSRLSDARTPTAHAASHATAGGDAITPADIGAATSAQGDTADTAVQPARAVNSGAGLEGGGDLSADRTLALTAATLASLALADTATQPGDDADTLGSGAATDGQVLTADGIGGAAWEDAAGGGSAAGADGEIQFALSGGFSSDAGLAYNSGTQALTVGGQVLPALGSAVAPGYAFSGRQDTGLRATSAGLLHFVTGGTDRALVGAAEFRLSADVALGLGAGNTLLHQDAPGILAQRKGTNPQTFRLANTWTNSSNLEQLSIGWSANVCTIATEALGTGTKRNLVLDGANRAAYSETPADIAAALVAHGIMAPA